MPDLAQEAIRILRGPIPRLDGHRGHVLVAVVALANDDVDASAIRYVSNNRHFVDTGPWNGHHVVIVRSCMYGHA